MIKRLLGKGELALMWQFYLALFVFYATDATGFIWVIYFLQQGFTFTQVSITIAVLYLGTALFEIPTGAVADSVGRKKSVIFGFVTAGFCWLLVPFAASSFLLLCLLLLVCAIATTFTSGADVAWMVDLLRSKGKSKYTPTFFMHLRSVSSVGLFFAGILGTILIGRIGMDWLFYAAGSGTILAGIILIFGNEEHFKRKAQSTASMLSEAVQNSKKALKFTLNHRIVLLLTLGAFFYTLSGVAYVGWQPYFIEQGIKLEYLPLIGSVGAIIGAITPQLYRKINKSNKKPSAFLAYSLALECLLLLLILLIAGPIFALFVYLMSSYGIRNTFGPVSEAYFQRFLPSRIRATVTSTRAMIMGIPGIIAFVAGGVLADFFGARNVIALSGLVMLPSVFLYYFAKAKRRGKGIVPKGIGIR